jgi:hypothetical protein
MPHFPSDSSSNKNPSEKKKVADKRTQKEFTIRENQRHLSTKKSQRVKCHDSMQLTDCSAILSNNQRVVMAVYIRYNDVEKSTCQYG